VLDTVNMNRLYLERYHYLQSTFLKTKDSLVQAESEDYRRALVQIAGQLKEADAEFRRSATGLLEMLSDKIGTEAEEKRLITIRHHLPVSATMILLKLLLKVSNGGG
jgi:phosphoenolpyruvate carboxylase